MAVLAIWLVLFLTMTGHSSASYCVCKDGVGDSTLQKSIDYACGAGADCTPILQNGPCFNPNTVKDHCNYAVNSYYQRKSQATGSCDFSGTAVVSSNTPSGQSSTCVYPSTASTGTTPSGTTPTTPTTGTPTTPGSTMTPGTATPGTSPPGSTFPGSTTTPAFGLGPTGTSITNPDGSSASSTLLLAINLSYSLALTLLLWGLIFSRV